MKLPLDFRDLLEEFGRDEVEYVVIGGYAFAFHVEPRATKDLDLLLEGSQDNLARAAGALSRFGAPAVVVEAVRRLGAREIAYLGQPPLRIDLMREIDGVDAAEVARNAVEMQWDGLAVRVIGLPELLANKKAAGRPRDLADAARLEQVLRARK